MEFIKSVKIGINEVTSAAVADNLESFTSNMDSGFMSSPTDSSAANFYSFYNQTFEFNLQKSGEGVEDNSLSDDRFNGSVSSSNGGEYISKKKN